MEEEDAHVTLTLLDNPLPQIQANTTAVKRTRAFTLDLNKQTPLTPVQEEDFTGLEKNLTHNPEKEEIVTTKPRKATAREKGKGKVDPPIPTQRSKRIATVGAHHSGQV